jgi:hypothetical protein
MAIALIRDDTYAEIIFNKKLSRFVFRWGRFDRSDLLNYGLDELPMSVRGKINMIRLLERGSYAAGLGGKSSDFSPVSILELLSVQLEQGEADQLRELNPQATHHGPSYKMDINIRG